jgi:triphosphoribosyl-dephospho-CoA synthase
MRDSIALLDRCFAEYCAALKRGATVRELRAIGRAAELQMFRWFGTNTHRGAIFLGGVLLAAVHRAPGEGEMAVRRALGAVARELFAEQLPQATKGARVRAGYGVGGIVTEVLNGLPSVFEVGLPALRLGRTLGLSPDQALLLAMAGLMQTVEDTTALRRCGPFGLERLKMDGARLETLLLDGANPMPFLVRTNRAYRRLHLTMGGVADLLGVCAGWDGYGLA